MRKTYDDENMSGGEFSGQQKIFSTIIIIKNRIEKKIQHFLHKKKKRKVGTQTENRIKQQRKYIEISEIENLTFIRRNNNISHRNRLNKWY